jgi:hypothetical protein
MTGRAGPVALFARDRFTAELGWAELAHLLPGWTIRTCPPCAIASHLDGVDVVCPLGARVDAAVLEAGQFGLVHQYGVGLEVDIARATELGVWVARVPGEDGGNADSVAELAILHLLAQERRLDEVRAALADGPMGGQADGRIAARVDRRDRWPGRHRPRGRAASRAVRASAPRHPRASRARRARGARVRRRAGCDARRTG